MKGILVLVFLVGVGCAPMPKPYTLGKVFQSVPPAPMDKAQVIFYGMSVQGPIIGDTTHYAMRLTEDDVVISVMPRSAYFVHASDPGVHEYRVGPRAALLGTNSVSLDLSSGQTYYVRYGQTSYVFALSPQLEVVTEDVALEELETLRQLRFHKERYDDGAPPCKRRRLELAADDVFADQETKEGGTPCSMTRTATP